MTQNSIRCRIGVDVGGTFTDVALEIPEGRFTSKVLTTPDAPEEAVFEGMDAVLARAGVQPADIGLVIHGTTLATNALIERTGAPTALITTEGFRDVLEMGTESRFDQYDLNIVKPAPLVPRRHRFTVRERVSATGDVLLPLDESGILAVADLVRALALESIAIAFLHSFAHPAHERRAAALVKERLPDISLSLSSEVSPEIREFDRFSTTCANAYVKPMVSRYLGKLDRGLRKMGCRCPFFLMLSGGTLTDVTTARRFPVRLVESGPAGGAVFAADVAGRHQLEQVMSFDMGGTTAKLCLIDNRQLPSARGLEVARTHRFKPGSGIPLRIPVTELTEIGAGGGSIARIDRLRRIAVGPESAGAVPGPSCYGRDGEFATVTDANLCVGRLIPDRFAAGRLTLQPQRAVNAVNMSVAEVLELEVPVAAAGIIEIINENMANAAREHATERGRTLRGRTLVAMGGSAPLHSVDLARKLGIDRIIVPASAGVGSALGFLRAPIAYEVARTAFQRLSRFTPGPVNEAYEDMAREAHRIVAQGAQDRPRTERRGAHMRYAGQGHEILVDVPCAPLGTGDGESLRAAFIAAYRKRYGRVIEGMDIEVLSWSLSVTAEEEIPPFKTGEGTASDGTGGLPAETESALFEFASGEWASAWVVPRRSLHHGEWIDGPGVITEDETTTVVPKGYQARVCPMGDIIIERIHGEPEA